MTNREFLSAIANNEALSPEIRDFATEGIAKLDKRNATRASKPSKTAIANIAVKNAISDFIASNANAIAKDIATALDITPQKASALCTQMVNAGVLIATDIKIKGENGTHKVKAYSLSPSPSDEE